MNQPLVLTDLLRRAREFFLAKEIVEYGAGAQPHRYTNRDFHDRVVALAGALVRLGVRPGDRVATLAWNHRRHLELYHAVPLAGAVLHTVNLRLEPTEIAYVIGHAGDVVVVADTSLLPKLEAARAERPGLLVVTTDGPAPGTLDYEAIVADGPPLLDPPHVDENALAALCYTSGTTGSPKGVGYSHRSLYLHTFAACLADGHAISERDTVLHVVPMFHANAWGIPFAALMTGAKQVLPGPHPAPAQIAKIIETERVTYTGMVPTVAADLVRHVTTTGADVSSLRALVLGGSPPDDELLRALDELGIPVFQGWGMTEISPMGTFSKPLPAVVDPAERRRSVRKQGRLLPGLQWRLVGDDGRDQPHDGVSRGELLIRGPWVATRYFGGEHPASFPDGWLRTGDIATIDTDGYLEIVDRAKDLIKSGGEWISSVALEQALTANPAVAEAAVVAVPHERWQERPFALVVLEPGRADTPDELLADLAGRVPRWWLPEGVLVVGELPRTSVGKIDKKVLRAKVAAGGPWQGAG
ncbi:long-chain fatty acid--CoA ligase [Amycolatopsis sp. FDAARGOS 1241]|uniref:long-chain fatty acid--CoA ligase n=1 Tax=Amycolatopsis sp. FDAARGOS 1241 TaxID=2778070 RepID=UPI00194F14D6|nr:long-chain fatty acid--CoA ligase [Amycolatopsis sp. FDAARGOS 1241]QRP46278.1 long-chain fatty acid--CoA ligase [Amycolatopsis sp. FDAARGOS 1241]